MNNLNLSGVIGNPVYHSKSPLIFKYLFDKFNFKNYVYSRIFLNSIEEISIINNLLSFDFINITAPFKNQITNEFSISNDTNLMKIYNLFDFPQNLGYNTDLYAIRQLFTKYCPVKQTANILIVGAGATSKLILSELTTHNITIANRSEVNLEEYSKPLKLKVLLFVELFESKREFDLIFNTVDNFQYVEKLVENFPNTIIINAVYSVEKYFTKLPKNFISGIEWLILQALKTFEIKFNIFTDETVENELKTLLNQNMEQKQHIFLNGFMGSGKTTVGFRLAKELNMNFINLDDEIENFCNMKINEIFIKYGEAKFREIETEVLKKVVRNSDSIIALGGGTCLKNINKEIIKDNGISILLLRLLEESYRDVRNSDRPLANNLDSFKDLFNRRRNDYISSTDLIIYNNSIEQTINNLKNEICKNR